MRTCAAICLGDDSDMCVHIIIITGGPISVRSWPLSLRKLRFALQIPPHWNNLRFFLIFPWLSFNLNWAEPTLNYKIIYILFLPHRWSISTLTISGHTRESRVQHLDTGERALTRFHTTHQTRQVHLFRSINFVRLACISTLYVALDAIQASSSSRCAIKLNWRGMHSPSSSETVIHLCHNCYKVFTLSLAICHSQCSQTMRRCVQAGSKQQTHKLYPHFY